jgi:polyribonucleotide nucleotidyltransferase
VAGDKDGVTALQLDVKCEGLDVALLTRALAQAHEGRLHILGKMLEAQPGPRTSLPENVPRIRKLKIEPSMCGAIIGKGGETITAIIADTGVDSIDLAKSEGARSRLRARVCHAPARSVAPRETLTRTARPLAAPHARARDAGICSIMGKTDESIEAAVARIEAVIAGASGPRPPRPEVVIGNAYSGEVKSVMPFGIFVELLPGLDGFCHISELSDSFVRKVEEVGLVVGDKIEVQVTSKNEKGQYRVRRILPGQELQPLPAEGEAAVAKPAKRPNGGGGGGRGGGPQTRGPPVGAAATAASNVADEAALSAAMSGLAEDVE